MTIHQLTGNTISVSYTHLDVYKRQHVVCLFPTLEAALAFEARIRPTLPPLKNQPEIFGEQLILDGEDTITGHSDAFLAGASGISVDETAALARSFGGTAFPAHIDRPSYSVPAALGDIPPVGFFAAEVTAMGDPERMQDRYPAIRGLPLLLNSCLLYTSRCV